MRNKIKLTLTVIATIMFFSQANAQQTAKMTSSGIGYLEYLPQGYKNNLNKYPIVISLHGIKEKGNTLSDVQRVANVGLPKYVKYGQQYPFILISPQLKTSMSGWTGDYVMQVINHVKKSLRIDDRRIYLTGLSLGGYGVWKTAAAYPQVFAAIVPICSGGNALSSACDIADQDIPVWAFHGTADNVVSYQVSVKMVNAINNCTPKPSPLAKITLYSGLSHGIWDKVYKESSALNWMLSYTNGSTSSTEPANQPPVAKAGSDITKTLPTNSTAIYGSATDADGTIASYSWSQVSGPSTASLTNKTTKTLTASSLVAGSYVFRLKATDNDGAYDTDDVKVTISTSSSGGNIAPIAKAGADKTTTSSSLKLYGSGTDSDGTIKYYKWYKTSGPYAHMYGVSRPTLELSQMVSGKYTFKLVVTDDKGATDSDYVTVTVGSSISMSVETSSDNLFDSQAR